MQEGNPIWANAGVTAAKANKMVLISSFWLKMFFSLTGLFEIKHNLVSTEVIRGRPDRRIRADGLIQTTRPVGGSIVQIENRVM